MDFGTFYRLRQLRERARDIDMMSDDVHESGNLYEDFDHSAHPQVNQMGFEGDAANVYGNNAPGRDFGIDQSWEFHRERDLNLGSVRDSGGMGEARGRGREMEPSSMRGGFGPGRGWPSGCGRGDAFNENPWTDHINETGPPWHHEGDNVWDEERRQYVEQRESQINSSERDDHTADLKMSVTSRNPQGPEDNTDERIPSKETVSSDIASTKANNLPSTSSDAQVHVPAKIEEKQSVTDQKLLVKEDEKKDGIDRKNKASEETGGQKNESNLDDDVSVNRVEGRFQDKPLEKDIIADIEDIAVTQLQDPNRTVFSCCYCGVSDYSIDDFKDHVKGDFHKQKFESLKEGKRRRQQNASLMVFKREELGRYSFLEMDLDSFRREPVIGLSYVTEFQSIFGIKCICNLCGILFSHISGQNHVTNFQHRLRYLKEVRPDSCKSFYQQPNRQLRMNAVFDIIQDAERQDGRGKPAIFVFERKAGTGGNSYEVDTEKFRNAFGEYVNKELQAARQKISNDALLDHEEQEESQTFTDQSDYVQLWDLEGDKARFFDDDITFQKDFSSKLGSESYKERGFIGTAFTRSGQKQRDQATQRKRGIEPPNEGKERALVSDNAETSDSVAGGGNITSDSSSKLRATDVSGYSSDNPALCSNDQREDKEPVIKETKNEKEVEQKEDDQQGSDGYKMPNQVADDKTNIEGMGKKPRFMLRETIPRHELGKVSYLKRVCKAHPKEIVIGLSCVTEYQHTTGIKCLCHLCGVGFLHACGRPHLSSYKHLLRYLREKKPKVYAELTELKTKREVMAQMIPIIKNIVKIEGVGDPKIHVFASKESSDKEALKSNSVSDKQTEDSSASTNMSQDEIDELERQHKEFFSFFHQEQTSEKAIEREPVIFELPKQDLPPSAPVLIRPPFPHPHLNQMGLIPIPQGDPYYMRMRAGPYFNPDPYEIARRAKYYPEQGSGDKPYLDPDPLKRIRPDPLKREGRQEPYQDPDPLKRDKQPEPYLDPDPLKRIIRREPYYDPNSLKRRAHGEPFLNLDPLKRLRFDEPYINPDPLKRVLPSQRAAKKPVVIDYGHGKSAKNTADQWEQDIKNILNESKVPDSLAQLSCSYSSPKKEDTPPPSQTKRPLPFSRSYMEKSKELQKKLSSSKKGRSQDSPDKEKSKDSNRSDSPNRKYRRSRSPLSIKDRSRAKLKDPMKRDWSDSSIRVGGRSKSPEIVGSSNNRYKQSRSPENFRSKTRLKDKDKTFMKKQRSTSPVKEIMTSSSRADKNISLPRTKSLASTQYEQMHPDRPENFSSRQKGSRKPDCIIDLTSDEESSLPSKKAALPTHPNAEKSSPQKDPEPVTGSDVDEAQANLIAEMLLKMKSSIIGQDPDPQSALKAILSHDITKVLLATKQLEERKSAPPRDKQPKEVDRYGDNLERQTEAKAGPSERHLNLKSNVKRTPPPRDKVAFAFAGRSNLLSQSVQFSDDNDDDDDN